MRNLTIRYIKQHFDSKIFNHGKAYFENSMVNKVIEEGYTLIGEVDGSFDNVYDVTIIFDYQGGIHEIECNCAYYEHCKHAAAVLLYYQKHGADEKRDIINPFNQLKDRQEETVTFDISPVKKGREIRQFLYNQSNKDSYIKKGKSERWRPIFVYGIDPDTSWSFNKNWIINLKMQYIKKDGELGRYDTFDESKITEIPEGAEGELYHELKERKPSFNSLEYYLDTILKNDIPLLMEYKDDLTPLVFHNHSKTNVSFTLKKVSTKKGTALFAPQLSFTYSKESKKRDKDIFSDLEESVFYYRDMHISCKSLNKIYVCPAESLVLYEKYDFSDKTQDILRLTEHLVRPNTLFDIDEIKELKGYITEHGLDNDLRVNFNKNKIVVKKILPQAVIEIEDITSLKIGIILNFKYSDRRISSADRKTTFLISPTIDKSDEIAIIERNKDLEDDIVKYISFLLNKDTITPSKDDDVMIDIFLNLSSYKFLAIYGMKLIDYGVELKYTNSTKKISRSSGNINISVTDAIDWFDFQTYFTDNDGKETPITFDKDTFTSGMAVVNDQYVLLSREDITALQSLFEEGMEESGKLRVSKLNFGALDRLYANIAEREKEELEKTREIINRIKDFKKIEQIKPSEKFNGTLRAYQQAGLNWLYFLNTYEINGILADDMGLGKTVQTLSLLQKLKDENRLGRVLLVVPVTTIANWEYEIEKFSPNLTYLRHIGTGRQKDELIIHNYDIIITSFHTLRNDIVFFKNINFYYIILDEAQTIKNINSKIFKSVKLINADHKLSLSGTPVENNTLDLWAQMDFLNHGLLGNLTQYKKNFAGPIERGKDPEVTEKLRKMVMPFVLRRKKEDVATDLPEKEIIIHMCEMAQEQKEVYEKVRDEYRLKVMHEIDDKGIEQSAITFFEALLRMRQAALFPSLIGPQYDMHPSAKFDTIKDILEEIITEKHKVLVFSQFVKTLKLIEKYIIDMDHPYSYLDGSTNNRDKQIRQFQEDEEVRLFLLSLKAGGVGINLTKADYVVLFDPWWNPAVERQAIDRAHRIGQQNRVIVYKLITRGTIEEKILKLQEKKMNLVNQLITEESSFYKSLTRDDILSLFD